MRKVRFDIEKALHHVSRLSKPTGLRSTRSVKSGAGEADRPMVGNEAKRTLFLRGKMRS